MLPKPIYPPRPKGKISHIHLARYEATGQWLVQRKFNGKHVVIWVNPETQEVGIWGRQTEELSRFRVEQHHKDELLSLNLDRPRWLAGELMHQKTKDPRFQGIIVLFDVVQFGMKQIPRLDLLSHICRKPTTFAPENIALACSPHVWMAETFFDHFDQHYSELLHLPEIEGVMLRRRDGVIASLGNAYYEVPWMIRVRKPNKLYTH